jgi:hypothetical protein
VLHVIKNVEIAGPKSHEMDIEDSIASGDFLDHHQIRLMSVIPEIDIHALSGFIGISSATEQHYDVANEIVDDRYTNSRWGDYMYCSMCMNPSIDSIVASYCMSCCDDPVERIQLFVQLYYSPILVLVPGSKDYIWRYFHRGIWVILDTMEVRRMMLSRLLTSNVSNNLGIDRGERDKVYVRVLRNIVRDRVGISLFCPRFDDIRDDKESVFAMPSSSYDVKRHILRRGLPSDRATLRGDVDACGIDEWRDKRSQMLNILSEWMSGDDVVNTYLDIVACAVGEFKPRYVVINSGTGSDGKSTWSHILRNIFGRYYAPLPSTGLAVDTKNSNDATPVLNTLMMKRMCLTPDAKDVVAMISSPGFKSISGGDEIYRRELHKEASMSTPSLKLLCIINTNQTSVVVTRISDLTRTKITRWLNKTVTEEDRAIIPSHQLGKCGAGIFNYERKFLNEYGSTLMVELLVRHKLLCDNDYRITVCEKIRQWTKELVSPKTILRFLEVCTDRVTEEMSTTAIVLHNNHMQSDSSETLVEDLFMAYTTWRKGGARFSATDPTNIHVFSCHLEFYYPIYTRRTRTGLEEYYVKDIRLKPEYDMSSMFFSARGLSMLTGGSLIGGLTSVHTKDPVIHAEY